MKTLVTHYSPDLDAITSCWLIKKYFPGWKNASLKFVPAGETLDEVSSSVANSSLIHVDTGMGQFDHHQSDKKTSASRLVLDYIKSKYLIKKNDLEAMERFVDTVTFIDNFNEIFLTDPESDIWELNLYQLIDGIQNIYADDEITCQTVFVMLDAALINFKHKIRAEAEIKKGLILKTRWGKTLFMENRVEESIKLAQKKGFALIVRRNPDNGSIRIKARPDTKEDLVKLFECLKQADPKATWFLHSSKRIVLNGSLKNPKTKPSTLTIKKIIEIALKIL